jgi:hypothetical protein
MKPGIRLTTLIGVFCSMLAVGLAVRSDNAGIVRKVHAKDGCSLDTLQGSYLVTGRADAPNGILDPSFPRVHLAVWNFDGQGNVSGFATASDGGKILRRTPIAATYTLDSDCTGTFTFVPGMPGWELFVTSDGKKGRTLNLNEGTIATRSFERR